MADALRVDRWLYYSRFYKTRRLATEAVAAGHVKLNGERIAPGKSVRLNDRIDLVRDRLPYAMTVVGIPSRRGPAVEAQRCYDEDDATALQRKQIAAALRRDRLAMPRTDGRPDKHTRRILRNRNRPIGR